MTKQLILASLIPALATQVSAINIVLDFDTHSTAFFNNASTGATARAAVQKAADDLSAAITTKLNAISAGAAGYNNSGTSGGSTANIDTSIGYLNPTTFTGERDQAGNLLNPSSVIRNTTPGLAADEFKIYVGAQALGGGILGFGSTGVSNFKVGGVKASNASLQAAADIASANSKADMMRGSNIVTASYSSNLDTAIVSTSFAPTIGSLWFDNDGSTTWSYDHTVTPINTDLYSVALHELMHTLGIGTYDSWKAQVSGVNWTGSNVIAEYGTGAGLIAPGFNGAPGVHITESILSSRLSDGQLQEVVMDPSIGAGIRKELTELDLAFMRDLGWETIPEPSSTLMLGLGSLALVLRRRK